jgi:hypothetical protein
MPTRAIWMGISPGPSDTRILVQDGPERTLLKARMPHSPHHPRALATLCEAMALWCGRRVHAALAADGPDTWCDTTRWLETFESISRGPLFEIELVSRARPPKDDGPEGMGDFRDCRQLVIIGAAR